MSLAFAEPLLDAALKMSDFTRILEAAGQGDPKAAEELLPLVYDDLRRLAAHKMAAEAPGQTLTPTSLVHEAYLRVVGAGARDWNNRKHFFAVAAEAMRRILIENARRKQAATPRGARPARRGRSSARRAGYRRQPARRPRGSRPAGVGRAGSRRVGEVAVLRRDDDRAGGRGAGHLDGDGGPVLGLRPGLAVRRDLQTVAAADRI